MHYIDIAIFLIYFLAMIGIGFYFYKKNKTEEDYHVGGMTIKLIIINISLPWGLDPNVFEISISAITFFTFNKILTNKIYQ